MFDALTLSWMSLAIIALIAVGIFIVCRRVVLWYFRIDQIADDLHTIAQHYRAQAAKEQSAQDREQWRQAQATMQERRAVNPHLATHPSA